MSFSSLTVMSVTCNAIYQPTRFYVALITDNWTLNNLESFQLPDFIFYICKQWTLLFVRFLNHVNEETYITFCAFPVKIFQTYTCSDFRQLIMTVRVHEFSHIASRHISDVSDIYILTTCKFDCANAKIVT